ncbi:MAG: hypothetical protein AAFV32_09605 [Myxococcota bacterium]
MVGGSGPQGTTFCQEARKASPGIGIFGVEASRVPGGGNFAGQGAAFSVNSRTGERIEGKRAEFGTSRDLNPISGPDGLDAGNRTVVVGGADSSKTEAEYLGGFAPKQAYEGEGRIDTESRGPLGPIDWLTGKSGFESCEEYFEGVDGKPGRRPRYSNIEALINLGPHRHSSQDSADSLPPGQTPSEGRRDRGDVRAF